MIETPSDEFVVLGGEENAAKNWLQIKEENGKKQNDYFDPNNDKRHLIHQSAVFTLSGNKGAKKNQKVMDTVLCYSKSKESIVNSRNKFMGKKENIGEASNSESFLRFSLLMYFT